MKPTPPAQCVTTSKTGFTVYLQLLGQHLAEACSKDEKLALLLIEITDLRVVNTSLGYEGGRQVLSEVAQRLAGICRSRDRVVQYADAAFALLLPNIRNEGHASLAVNKVLRELKEPIVTTDSRITVDTRVGVAMFPEHGKEAGTLMQHAEIAQASARQAREQWRIFTPAKTAEVTGLIGLENELDQAMAAGDLEMHFQPMIDLRTGEPCGAEALMRWRHATRGFVPPDVFIDIADRGGQIFDLSWFALNTALRELGNWPVAADFQVSVNATPNIVQFPDLLDIVANALSVWSVPANQLMLEVTETALMTDPEASFRNLHGLRRMGVNIAIDDFGTGYSSLAYFKNIPATELKIDKSFVLNMKEDAADRQIVRSVIDLAHGFGLKVVAEGIEDQFSADLLREWGCDIAQGYFYSRPVPARELKKWLSPALAPAPAPA